VAPAAESEVGVLKVTIGREGADHPVFNGLEGQHHVMQWHHAEVQEAPAGARVLASSARTDVQAIAVGDCAIGLQFHAEFTPQTVASWQSLPGHLNSLTETLGEGAYDRLSAEALPLMPAMGDMTRRIYTNFKSFAGLDMAAVSLARKAAGSAS
jgi:GMP synthase-like glutamine amidotransferase